jgi:hypothetical protein
VNENELVPSHATRNTPSLALLAMHLSGVSEMRRRSARRLRAPPPLELEESHDF